MNPPVAVTLSDEPASLLMPEVGQVGVLAAVIALEEHVLRLDVSMHERARVRGVERRGHLSHDRDRLSGRQPSRPGDQLAQVGPSDVAHGYVELAALLARVVNRNDVGVLDRRRKA